MSARTNAGIEAGEAEGERVGGQQQVVQPLHRIAVSDTHPWIGKMLTVVPSGIPRKLPWLGSNANTYESSGASQNTGVAIATCANTVSPRSQALRGLSAPSRPMGIAIIIHITPAMKIRDMLTPAAGRMI